MSAYWDRNRELVEDVDVEGWIATSDDDDRMPDICIYLAGPSSSKKVPDRVPELVYEFVSASRSDQERDYIHKRQEYHNVGVQEYVIVDRFKKQVLVLHWAPEDFSETVLSIDDTHSSPLLPGLAISIRKAFV